MPLLKKLFKPIITTALLAVLATPAFAKNKTYNLNYYLGLTQNLENPLQGEEFTVGILHNSSGLGLGLHTGELRYEEKQTEDNPEPMVARVEGTLNASAKKQGISMFYNPQDYWINFAAQAGKFNLEGEGRTTITAYGAPPFENQSVTINEEAKFTGDGHEIMAGFSMGTHDFRLKLLASYFKLQINYKDIEAEPKILEGLLYKAGFNCTF